MGASDLLLWVLVDNHDAQRAYAGLGFVPTGERQFLTPFVRFEWQFTLGIRRLLETNAHHNRLIHHRMPNQVSDVPDSALAASADTTSNGLFSSVHEGDFVPTVKRPTRMLDIDLRVKPLSG